MRPGKSYDAEKLNGVMQQKCLAHLIRNPADVAKQKTGRAKHFSARLKHLLRQSPALAAGRTEISPRSYRKQARQLDKEITDHLRDRLLADPDNQRLLNGAGNAA